MRAIVYAADISQLLHTGLGLYAHQVPDDVLFRNVANPLGS